MAVTASSARQPLPCQHTKATALTSRRHCCWTAATAAAGHCLAAQRGTHCEVQKITAAAMLLLLLLLVVEDVEVQGDTVLLLLLLLQAESLGCQGLLQACAVLERFNGLRLCRKTRQEQASNRSSCLHV
jgi:hypothetical protein